MEGRKGGMFWATSYLVDNSQPSSPVLFFRRADTTMTYLWMDPTEEAEKKERERGKRSKIRCEFEGVWEEGQVLVLCDKRVC